MKYQYQEISFAPQRLGLIEVANEIIEEFTALGYDLTLRQLYYQLVARAIIDNNENSYKRISVLLSDGRLAGLIDWDAIVDRTRQVESLPHFGDVENGLAALRASFRLDKWATQENRVEVWVEKEAAIGIVARTCNRLDVPYFATRGYTSQTAMRDAATRLMGYYDAEPSQYPVVIYLGDHDPSGMDMSRDIEDRLEMFMEGVPVAVTRLALNMDQIRQYDPPPNPTKFTDRRSAKYNDLYGFEGWELDALSPDVVDALITAQINLDLDKEEWDKIEGQEADIRSQLSLARQLWPEVLELIQRRTS